VEKGVNPPVPVKVTSFDFAFLLVIVNEDTDSVHVVPDVHRAFALSLDGEKCAGLPLMLVFGSVSAEPAAPRLAPLAVRTASAVGVSASPSSRPELPTANHLQSLLIVHTLY
jgi:hypothetical protein